MSPVKVLDHGFVRLVDSMGGDISVVRAARNSYDAAWRAGANDGDDTKLVHYLWRNKHVSPFEAVTFTFEVQAPIFVLRQWMRHEQSYNEVSGRYTELPELYYTPDPAKIGIQSKSSKQARDMNDDDEEMILLRKIQIDKIKSHNKRSFELYRELINSGWPRELARTHLPLATYSKMFVTMNLRNLLFFLQARLDKHAQYEIRVYAERMVEMIRPIVPVCVEAWEKANTKPVKIGVVKDKMNKIKAVWDNASNIIVKHYNDSGDKRV